jgi:hypothetical protein
MSLQGTADAFVGEGAYVLPVLRLNVAPGLTAGVLKAVSLDLIGCTDAQVVNSA